MKLHRRQLLRLGAGAVVFPAVWPAASAQSYPTRPVHLVVGFPAGGPTDVVARLIAQWLSKRLGQPFIVENRPGAASNLAAEAVVRSQPDGYTLLLAASANAINATLYDRLSFNFTADTTAVAGIMRQSFVMVVNPSVPAAIVPEFISYAKASPGTVKMASAGIGTPHHIFGELFMAMTGTRMLHVPYRGEAPALIDLLAGRVQAMFASVSGAVEFIRAGRLRALGVTTATRAKALPDAAALGDFVPGFEASAWIGIVATKKAPDEIVQLLNKEINLGLADPEISARLGELGAIALPGTPAAFETLIADETQKWAQVIKSAGIKAE